MERGKRVSFYTPRGKKVGEWNGILKKVNSCTNSLRVSKSFGIFIFPVVKNSKINSNKCLLLSMKILKG
jgi:hypothetical protein